MAQPRELGRTRSKPCQRLGAAQCPLNFSGLVPTEGWSRLVASENPYAEVWIAVGPGSIQPGCLPKSSCEMLPLALKGSRGPGSSWAESVVCSLLLRRQLATSLSFLADCPGWSAWESDTGWDRGGRGLEPSLDSDSEGR